MSNKYDLLVFIGRFQPFHVGHRQVVELAMQQCKHLLILVGSSYQPRTIKNPFTFNERMGMIQNSLDPQHLSRLTIRPLRDYMYNEQRWITEVQNSVSVLVGSQAKVGIIGYKKDESSYYLDNFPQWDFVEIGKNYVEQIDATTIRNNWYSGMSPRFSAGVLSSSVQEQMRSFQANAKEFQRLQREYEHICDYKKQWQNTPYPVTFTTVDAVVVQSGHVLLVRRKASPGENLLALPGGFVNQNERIHDAMIRELREETKIKVPEPVLRGSVKAQRVFDAPNRSLRGRTITHAFLIELAPGKLPLVKGGDDAAKAQWIPLDVWAKSEEEMFEDHYQIISYFFGQL